MDESVEELQTLVTNVHTLSRKFGLTINKGKTEVQMISKEYRSVSVYIDEEKLKQVETFIYLGGVITDKLTCTDDIKRRIGLAMAGMKKLTAISKSKEITMETKMELHRVLIPSFATYDSESWAFKKSDENRLLVFKMSCLRRIFLIFCVSRRDKVRNISIRETTKCQNQNSWQNQIQQSIIFWSCYPLNYRYPKIALEGWIPWIRFTYRGPEADH